MAAEADDGARGGVAPAAKEDDEVRGGAATAAAADDGDVAELLQRRRQIYRTWGSCYGGGGRIADRGGAAMGRGGG